MCWGVYGTVDKFSMNFVIMEFELSVTVCPLLVSHWVK